MTHKPNNLDLQKTQQYLTHPKMHLTHNLNHLTVKLPCHLKILIYRCNNTSTGDAKILHFLWHPHPASTNISGDTRPILFEDKEI